MFGSDGLRGKKAIINFLGSTGTQIITVICGFIVPRIIIGTYGSEANGLMHSIAQFLSYITLLESGVAGVVRAALYKPLSEKDNNKISGVVMATENFFRKVCLIFVIYAVLLACFFPFMAEGGGWLSTFLLVLIIAVSTVSQYYFGITYNVLLQADQKRYIYEMLGASAVLFNAVFVFICARAGASLHVMKLVSSTVFAVRPMILNLYVKKNYSINRSVQPDNAALSQRWDGMGHHIAFFLHQNTDVVILTIFSKISQAFSIAEVSVYSVYHSIVVYGIERIVNILHLSVEAGFGDLIAQGEKALFRQSFKKYEQFSLMLNTFIFTCTAMLIIPFMSVYIKGVTDADYIRPMFAYMLTLAEALFCLRKPYNNVTLAAGHYRQTKKGAYLEAGLNIALSVILVIPFGVTGVAAGTAIAMGVRTFEYVRYLYKNLLEEKLTSFFARLLVNLVSSAVTIGISMLILPDATDSYLSFAFYAVIIATVCGVSVLLFNFIFFPSDIKNIFSTVRGTIENFLKR